MIGKPHWFRRKRFGWGATPVTWEGWVYLLVAILPLVLILYFTDTGPARNILVGIWVAVILVDLVDITLHLPKD